MKLSKKGETLFSMEVWIYACHPTFHEVLLKYLDIYENLKFKHMLDYIILTYEFTSIYTAAELFEIFWQAFIIFFFEYSIKFRCQYFNEIRMVVKKWNNTELFSYKAHVVELNLLQKGEKLHSGRWMILCDTETKSFYLD